MPRARPPKIQVYHTTAPTCFWSWGYEAVFNRLPLVYGDQIGVNVMTSCIYTDFEEYLKHYELTFDGLLEWTREGADIMGVPLGTDLRRETIPESMLPASLAAMAGYRQGPKKGGRFNRALMRRWCVELQDVTKLSVQLEAAGEAGLDLAKFQRDVADKKARQAELGHQGHDFPHLPLGFYNLIVSDEDSKTVVLDYAFDPAVVEDAIDWLSGGRLKKAVPKDIAGYLRAHGPAPLTEIARVFGLPPSKTEKDLARLEASGKAERLTLAGGPHWRTSSS
ncbi:MAG: hypothetical protein A3K65_09845 [Euryarchaeota archaeon RBG_16_68_12]|nr:MAG: hypothetical protein A3K65_09845 [Euryarchaeota archaeon RBG_16_68_12]